MPRKFSGESPIVSLSDDTVVLYGEENYKPVLKRFRISDQVELETVQLQDYFYDMTEVKLDGKHVLALSYG